MSFCLPVLMDLVRQGQRAIPFGQFSEEYQVGSLQQVTTEARNGRTSLFGFDSSAFSFFAGLAWAHHRGVRLNGVPFRGWAFSVPSLALLLPVAHNVYTSKTKTVS